MLASRIYRICRLTGMGFILVMLFVSYTYCVSEASASPVVSAEHDPLEAATSSVKVLSSSMTTIQPWWKA